LSVGEGVRISNRQLLFLLALNAPEELIVASLASALVPLSNKCARMLLHQSRLTHAFRKADNFHVIALVGVSRPADRVTRAGSYHNFGSFVEGKLL